MLNMTCSLSSYARDFHARFHVRPGENTTSKCGAFGPINLILQTVLFTCNFGVFISNLCVLLFFLFTVNKQSSLLKKRVVRKIFIVAC